MKVYMKVSNRDQLDVSTRNLRALNFAHVKLHVVTPPVVEELVLAHETVVAGDREMEFLAAGTSRTNANDLSDTQLTVEEFVVEVSKTHADLIVIPCCIEKEELAMLIEKTPCSILINRCCMESEFSIKSVLATDHTLYANLAIEKFRSFRPAGFAGATVISTELDSGVASGVGRVSSVRIPDMEAVRSCQSGDSVPLLSAIVQECQAKSANLLMVATHSLRSGAHGSLGQLLPEIIDSVDASVLILKAY